MKKSLIKLALLSLVTLLPTLSAADTRIDSVYSSLSSADCKMVEQNTQEAWSKSRCAGTDGYNLYVYEGDLRQSISILDPKKREHALNFWDTVSSAFSSLGQKAEWRVQNVNGKKQPIALIVRFNVSENPEYTEKLTSYLVVSKITNKTLCVTDVVKPSADANQQARDLADTAANRPCKATS